MRPTTLKGAVLAALFTLAACQEEQYVIGRFHDAECDEHAGALVCSGFERPDLSEWSEVVLVKDASVEQTDVRSYDGAGALHAESTGNESAAVVAKEFTAVRSGEVYLRAHLYVPSDLPTKTMNIFFLGDYATPDPFKGVDFNLEDGAFSIYSPGNNPDRVTSTAAAIPRDEWFCVRIRLAVSETEGAVAISVNEDVVLEHQGMNTNPEGGVHLLRAGVDWSSEQADPFDFFIDDLLLDTAPVECGD